MKRISTSLIGAVAALAALGASSASAATVSGVVVHDNGAAHSFVVAQRTGNLVAIHAHRLPRLGRVTVVTARRLRNGTWVAQRVRQGRASSQVKLRGAVTFVDQRRHEFVVSARGASLLVHERPGRSRGLHAAADPSLAVGEEVAVDGTLEDNSVAASQVNQEGQDRNGLDLEGTIEQVDDTNRTLTVSADDSEQSGATSTVEVPESFDITKFSPGEEVELIVSPGLGDTFTLEQGSDDSGSRHADNPAEMQGDDHGDAHASAEQQCAAEQSDPSFAASHNGLTFTQFYERDANDANNAFGRCVNAKADAQESSASGSGSPQDAPETAPGSGGSAGSGETHAGSSAGTGSGSTSSGTDDSTTTSDTHI